MIRLQETQEPGTSKVLVGVGAGRKGKRGRRRDEAGCPGEASGRLKSSAKRGTGVVR
jgi:hypothetical protein